MLHKYLNINNGILRFLDQMVLRDFNGTLLTCDVQKSYLQVKNL